jgi:hypothetical protein
MWQRIQTVFLVLIIISLLVSFVLPIWELETNALTAFYFLKGSDYQYFPYSLTAILGVASITMAFIEIRSFKNRLLQRKLGAFNSLLLACTIGSAFYFSNSMMNTFQAGHLGFGLWLPGAAVLFNFLANRFILRDEKIVRDSDRLR